MGNDVAEVRLAALRDRAVVLARDEEDLLQRLQAVRAEKTRNATTMLEIERALVPVHAGRRTLPEHTWRRAVRELGTFTFSELAAELGCSKAVAKRHVDELIAAGVVKSAGRFAGKAVFEYVKPTDAGEAFTAQQETRPTIKLPTPEQQLVGERAERPHDIRQSRLSGIADKEIRAVAREAIALGWQLEQRGRSGHVFRLVRDTDAVTLPSTPRNSGSAADALRHRLGLRGARKAS
jgi:DNA-binding MarR family transcriptional regulator